MSKRKEKARQRNQRTWEKNRDSIELDVDNAPGIKAVLRENGCDLPFYEFLDSYADEFHRIVREAKSKYPTLIDVHEVDDSVYDTPEWSAHLGYAALTKILFDIEERITDYGEHEGVANICGITSAFLDSQGGLRTVVMIRNCPKGGDRHREVRYALKVVALAHEIGHVHDIEHGTNFDVSARRSNIIEAEIFAHLHSFDVLAKRQMVHSYEMLHEALVKARTGQGYFGEVARGVIERLPKHPLVRWNDVMRSINLEQAMQPPHFGK